VRGQRRRSPVTTDGEIVQPKLTVGAADDAFEREADVIASAVAQLVRSGAVPVGADHGDDGEGPDGVQTSGGRIGRVRRTTAEIGDPPPITISRIQRSSVVGSAGGDLDDETTRILRSSRSGGATLADPARAQMERAFGADFSGVRVHTDATSTELNNRIQAKAFTTGSDIYFRDGAPDIGNRADTELLAHELTHVVQQGGAGVRRSIEHAKAPARRPQRVSTDRSQALRRHTDPLTVQAKIDALESTVAKRLMTGVLDTANIGAAARRVYKNMFAYADEFGWTYKASFGGRSGADLIDNGGKLGMCETYRNAFRYVLETYLIPLTRDFDPLSDELTIEEGQALTSTKFVTKPGLALLGRPGAYNVSKTLNAKTGAEGVAQRYLFSSHWQLIVGGTTYDPLFDSTVVADPIEWTLSTSSPDYYTANGANVAFVALAGEGATAGGEFAGQYTVITNPDVHEDAVAADPVVAASKVEINDIVRQIITLHSGWVAMQAKRTGKASWEKRARRTAGEIAVPLRQRQQQANDKLATLMAQPAGPLVDQAKRDTLKGIVEQIKSRSRQAAVKLEDIATSNDVPRDEMGTRLHETITELTLALNIMK
jgi:hypothetical protein